MPDLITSPARGLRKCALGAVATLAISILTSVAAAGDFFTTPGAAGSGATASAAGKEISDLNGNAYWFQAPSVAGTSLGDFRTQTYDGQPVLTWWQGTGFGGLACGTDYIANLDYQVIATVNAGNGYCADGHELQLTPNGDALITVYTEVREDLTSIGGNANQLVLDGIAQEINVATGQVVWQWNPIGHVPFSESEQALPGSANSAWDWFHINAVHLDTDGNILVDSRDAWTIFKVSSSTGNIIWQLGGKASTFTLQTANGQKLNNANEFFSWQHDPEALGNNTYTVFDNDSAGTGTPASPSTRAESFQLNTSTDVATLEASNYQPENLVASSQGNAQTLPDGDQVVGWGALNHYSEFTPGGTLDYDANWPNGAASYRVWRFPWSGAPLTSPTVDAVDTSSGGTNVNAFWDGATQVAQWEVLGGASPSSLSPYITVPWESYNTSIPLSQQEVATSGGQPAYVQVVAEDSNGNPLGSSPVTAVAAQGSPAFDTEGSLAVSEGQPVIFPIQATEGTATNLTLTNSGNLPSGVKFSSDGTDTEELTGTPAYETAGTYPITVTATDGGGNSTTQSFTLTVATDGPQITSPSNALNTSGNTNIGNPVNHLAATFAENAAGTPVTFQAIGDGTATGGANTGVSLSESGALPQGVSFTDNTVGGNSDSATLAGTPAFGTAGNYPIVVTATDANGATQQQYFVLTVSPTGPSITSANSATLTENTAGSFAVTGAGDIPLSFSETGNLPSGVTLASSGELSGTPAYGTAGTYPITITATDSNGATATQNFTLTVDSGPPSFNSADAATFTEKSAGTFTVSATSSSAVTLSESGNLPAGVTFTDNNSGDTDTATLAGTPAYGTTGTYPITITASEGNGQTAQQNFTLTVISGQATFSSAAATTFTENAAGSFTVSATGDGPVTLSEAGPLPSGVSFTDNATGTGTDTASLAGTPAYGTAGGYPITITAHDGNGATAQQSFTLTVNAGPPSVTSANSASFTEDAQGTLTVKAAGDGPLSFSETGSLPTGVTLSSGGVLAGTPAYGTAGSYPVTLTVTDANGATAQQNFTLSVAEGTPFFTSPASTQFTENAQGTFTASAAGDGPITFSETGKLPAGVTFAPSGTVLGAPAFSTAGTYAITLTATDTNGNTTSQAFTLTVKPGPPEFTSPASYSVAEQATAGFGVFAEGDGPLSLSESGNLPAGLRFTDLSTGTGTDVAAITGKAAAFTAGVYPIKVTATDTHGQSTTQDLTITVTPAAANTPTVTSVSPASGLSTTGSATIKGTNFRHVSAVRFGAQPATFTVVSKTRITVEPPLPGAGTVDVTVTTNDGTSATSAADHYTYVAPAVTSVSPASGPAAGGTTVVIHGTHFTGATAVNFGAVAATALTVNSSTKITITSPPGTGTVDVTVTTPTGTSATVTADHFTYTGTPSAAVHLHGGHFLP